MQDILPDKLRSVADQLAPGSPNGPFHLPVIRNFTDNPPRFAAIHLAQPRRAIGNFLTPQERDKFRKTSKQREVPHIIQLSQPPRQLPSTSERMSMVNRLQS
jgi:hypothetical protein